MENASFGLTICAERTALVSWIAQAKQADAIVAIAIYGAKTSHHHITPCGACRQSLVEFMSPSASVVYQSKEGTLQQQPIAYFLPENFML